MKTVECWKWGHPVQWETSAEIPKAQGGGSDLGRKNLTVLHPNGLSPACPLESQTLLDAWAGKMVEHVKVLGATADDLIPGTHMVEIRNCSHKLCFDLHVHTLGMPTHNK